MCDICRDNSIRDYTHSRTPKHFRILLKIMKMKQSRRYYQRLNDSEYIS